MQKVMHIICTYLLMYMYFFYVSLYARSVTKFYYHVNEFESQVSPSRCRRHEQVKMRTFKNEDVFRICRKVTLLHKAI